MYHPHIARVQNQLSPVRMKLSLPPNYGLDMICSIQREATDDTAGERRDECACGVYAGLMPYGLSSTRDFLN